MNSEIRPASSPLLAAWKVNVFTGSEAGCRRHGPSHHHDHRGSRGGVARHAPQTKHPPSSCMYDDRGYKMAMAGGRTMIDNNHWDENGGDDNTETACHGGPCSAPNEQSRCRGGRPSGCGAAAGGGAAVAGPAQLKAHVAIRGRPRRDKGNVKKARTASAASQPCPFFSAGGLCSLAFSSEGAAAAALFWRCSSSPHEPASLDAAAAASCALSDKGAPTGPWA